MPGEVELRVYFQSSMSNIPATLVWGLLAVFIIVLIVMVWKKGWRKGLRASSVLLLVEWVFLILCTADIFRESGESYRINLVPLLSYFDIAENSYLMEKVVINVLNVALFIPVGLLLGLGFKVTSWKGVSVIGLGLSFLIELLQLVFKRGLCEIDDVIHNLLGCMIGFAIYRLSLRLINNV